jgi:membrane-bound lytic murein transglycosylase
MKLPVFVLALLVFPTVSVMAQDNEQNRAEIEQYERLEFRRDSRSESQRYSFEDYIQDLTAAARSDEPQRDNPVSQLASNQRQEYKPLNPMTILRW